MNDRRLLTLQEVKNYLNIGETKARELIRGNHGFSVKIGNRWYADRIALDKWLEANRR